jgi:acetyl-CoA C-acetyltransferase
MKDVAIIGIGQTKVGEHWEIGIRHLGLEALQGAMLDAGVDRFDSLYVGNMLSGELSMQENLGALIADFAGARGVEAVKVEAAGASGAAALRMGYGAVAGGLATVALVLGLEKMTDATAAQAVRAQAMGIDADHEAAHGLSLVAVNALLMRRYMHEYGYNKADFAPFPVNAHANGMHNPFAQFHVKLTPEAYARATMVADPINVFDSSAVCDGAAALVLVPAELAKQLHQKPVKIAASAMATDSVAVHDRRDPLLLEAVAKSAADAYAQSGLTPKDIDLFELHDASSILATLSLEATGLADRGKGVAVALDGEIGIGGRVPISTLGGLKARGNPIGATGVYQVVEIVQQLRGQAGESQVQDARLGLAQSIGGSGATAVTHILERMD